MKRRKNRSPSNGETQPKRRSRKRVIHSRPARVAWSDPSVLLNHTAEENSRRLVQLEQLRHDDPQAARAKELELLGEPERAARVRMCRNPASINPGWVCGQRCCRGCAATSAAKAMRSIAAATRRFLNPVVLLIWVDSTCVEDLAATFDLFRRAWPEFTRSRALRRAVTQGIGRMEAVLTPDRNRWHLHLHLAVDALSINAESLDELWSALVDGRGHVSLDPDGELRNSGAFARYVTKVRTLCPEPGELDLHRLFYFFKGMHRRHLTVEFGTGWRSRKKAPPGQGGAHPPPGAGDAWEPSSPAPPVGTKRDDPFAPFA